METRQKIVKEIEIDFEYGDRVSFRMDPSRFGLVISLEIWKKNIVRYRVCWDDMRELIHYGEELELANDKI